ICFQINRQRREQNRQNNQNHFAHIAVPFLAVKSSGLAPESRAGRRGRLNAARCGSSLSGIADRIPKAWSGSWMPSAGWPVEEGGVAMEAEPFLCQHQTRQH